MSIAEEKLNFDLLGLGASSSSEIGKIISRTNNRLAVAFHVPPYETELRKGLKHHQSIG